MTAQPCSIKQYAELAELAGGFIHEIKNHLSTLGLNLQLLAEDFQEPQTQRERRALERIQRLQNECQRLVDVSNDFLRFARVKDLELSRPTSARSSRRWSISSARRRARPTSRSRATSPPTCRRCAGREMFKQALLNLMLNAEQAMPQGGEMTIQAARGAGRASCLSLIDTGKGMSRRGARQGVSSRSSRRAAAARAWACRRRARSSRRTAARSTCRARSARARKFTIRLPISKQSA